MKYTVEIENVREYQAIGLLEVDPATVGQYTGLHDKNGQEIYDAELQ